MAPLLISVYLAIIAVLLVIVGYFNCDSNEPEPELLVWVLLWPVWLVIAIPVGAGVACLWIGRRLAKWRRRD